MIICSRYCIRLILYLVLLLSCPNALFSQEVRNVTPHPDRLRYHWPAQWIAHPTASAYDFGVYHFRRTLQMDSIPQQLTINVSADNRYRLFVNGRFVVAGPSRGDLLHWRFETVDISPFLQKGTNTIAALVWNYGEHRPWAQISLQTGFVLQVDDTAYLDWNTGPDWRVLQDTAYAPITDAASRLRAYIVTGPRLQIDGAHYPWGWEQTDYDDSHWVGAHSLRNAHPRGNGTEFYWELVPRPIPLRYERREPELLLRTASSSTPFLQSAPITVPADTTMTFMLDQTYLTNAYPYLQVSGGAGSSIRLEYAESLIGPDGQKHNRNEVAGKSIRGYYDIFLPDGGEQRLFTTPWFRVWRYIEVTVTTRSQPLTLEQFYGMRTGYPFEEKASFASDEERLSDVWDVGWRTAELCAGETYYDCPYYEQLQYVGDTRIQALISLYVSGDDRLMRQALQQYEQSRLADGLTMSRYPSWSGQVIPPYSLFWICMVNDYWWYRSDEDFVRSLLPGVKSVLRWHEQQLGSSGLLGYTPFWNFVDWTDEWPWNPKLSVGGVPDLEGGSSILSLQLVYALQAAEQLLQHFGEEQQATQYRELAHKIKRAVIDKCWDTDRQLLADTPSKKAFSQHANILVVLTDAVPESEQQTLLERLLITEGMIPVTFYYRFYLFQALFKTGLGDRYLEELQPWYDMLDLGLTTFAEKPDPTRSDCHAWSASPNYDLLATVAGIRPGSPGFRTVHIRPHPGGLQNFAARMPHPEGWIEVKYRKNGDQNEFFITLPANVPGTIWYHGQRQELSAGRSATVVFPL